MNEDLGLAEVRYHEFPEHVRCGGSVEGVQKEDPRDEEPGGVVSTCALYVRDAGQAYRVYHGSLYPEV